MKSDPCFVGIDVGTSGVRAVAVNGNGDPVAQGSAKMAEFGSDHRAPDIWRKATVAAFSTLSKQISPSSVRSLAVDGTSGTMLAADRKGRPVARALMYNDPATDQTLLKTIARVAPSTSTAHGATSALARAIALQGSVGTERVLHQADWIAGLFSGRFDVSDANNALKTGFDPVQDIWPEWLNETGVEIAKLPEVLEPGTPVGTAEGELADHFDLPSEVLVVTGTTDGCASFLATGANKTGDAVTVLGSTLTIKILSDAPIFAPEFGIYSHRVPGGWLAGGASNSGGNVIAAHFDDEAVAAHCGMIDPSTDSGLQYYPLLRPGERFPFNDPEHAPRMEPRPSDDTVFLKAILEGIADIETTGYRRLAELGAPEIRSMRTVGGGAGNEMWSRMRKRRLGIPFKKARAEEAAVGTAFLALAGARKSGLA